jgi:hypothetical protein
MRGAVRISAEFLRCAFFGWRHRQRARYCFLRFSDFSTHHSLLVAARCCAGTYMLSQLEDQFPDVMRFVACVSPSQDDDVITSPYNSTLAISQLIDHADAVLPIENEALSDIISKVRASCLEPASVCAVTLIPLADVPSRRSTPKARLLRRRRTRSRAPSCTRTWSLSTRERRRRRKPRLSSTW